MTDRIERLDPELWRVEIHGGKLVVSADAWSNRKARIFQMFDLSPLQCTQNCIALEDLEGAVFVADVNMASVRE